ncbi:MAG: glycosyltransferase [Planctomycetes bacterium]|nr:glycosyltransferase [Planctomycetota bacterium]
MLCYHFPPAYNGGVERSAKFAHYLPQFGWEPHVLTTSAHGREPGWSAASVRYSSELLNHYRWIFNQAFRRARRLGRPAAVYPRTAPQRGWRRKVLELIEKWLLIPDHHIGWALPALWPAWRWMRKGSLDVIYTTSPPASPHLLGFFLKRLTGRPWVMDLRDPWTFEPMSRHLREPGWRLELEKALERRCIEAADAVILNTPETLARYRPLHPESAGKMLCISNGFDGEEIDRAAARLDQPGPWKDFAPGQVVISHAGSLYRYDGAEDRPAALLEVLSGLKQCGRLTAATCRLVFAGPVDAEMRLQLAERGLAEVADFPGLLSHFDSIRLMLRSDWLLLYDPGRDGSAYVRGKLYDYLGCGKPILGIVPEGASRELLKRAGGGFIAPPDDPDAIRSAFDRVLGRSPPPPAAPGFNLRAYERKALAGDLARLLDRWVR